MLTNGEAWRRTGMSSVITAMMTAGAQANELRLELERKIQESERRLEQRMMTIERTDETIQQTQREMWNVISNLPPDEFEEDFENLRERIRRIEIWIIKKDDSYDVPE